MQFHTLGLDLAGSLTATGGVGAVLASTTGNDTQNYLYDRTGNVIGITDRHRGDEEDDQLLALRRNYRR